MANSSINNPMNLSHEERFHENAGVCTRLTYRIVSDATEKGFQGIDPLVLDMAVGVIQGTSKRDLIETFITNSEKYWVQIHEKSREFMINNAFTIFKGLPETYVGAFSRLFKEKDSKGQSYINVEHEANLWKVFHSLVKICIKFIHDQRGPYAKDGQARYKVRYMPEIDINKHALKWDVKLIFPSV